MSNITINTDSLRTSREWKRHKIQDGSNVYRILPPYGDVETHNNYPYRKWSVAWLVNPSTGKRTPFASPLTDGDDRCPVKEYQDALREHLDKKKAAMEAEGYSSKDIKETLKPLYDVQWQVRVQHSYAYNAADKSGQVGLLELKPTAHKEMKKRMMEYIQQYGQDPTSLNYDLKNDAGVWFNITKEGQGKSTEYGVEFCQIREKQDDGSIIKKDDRSPLPQDVVDNYNELGYDLSTIYRRKNYDELKDILLYNLALFAEDVPECVLPGWEEATQTDTSTDVSPNTEPESRPAANSGVSLNLSDDDDVSTTGSSSQPAAKSGGSDMEDIKSFADSVLKD